MTNNTADTAACLAHATQSVHAAAVLLTCTALNKVLHSAEQSPSQKWSSTSQLNQSTAEQACMTCTAGQGLLLLHMLLLLMLYWHNLRMYASCCVSTTLLS
jgi:hypothetical protein